MAISRSIHVAINGIFLFFFIAECIPLYLCTTSSLSTPLSMDIQFASICCCCSVTHGVSLFATPWTAAHQASLGFTASQSLLMTISSSVVPFSSCPHSFPASESSSNKLTLRIGLPKYWNLCFH